MRAKEVTLVYLQCDRCSRYFIDDYAAQYSLAGAARSAAADQAGWKTSSDGIRDYCGTCAEWIDKDKDEDEDETRA